MTFDEVIEEHRIKTGADKVRVYLGEEATPEGVAAELEKIRLISEEYNSFSELERERAKSYSLYKILGEIARMCQRPISDNISKEQRAFELAVFDKCDMLFTNIDDDVEYMKLKREGKSDSQISLILGKGKFYEYVT